VGRNSSQESDRRLRLPEPVQLAQPANNAGRSRLCQMSGRIRRAGAVAEGCLWSAAGAVAPIEAVKVGGVWVKGVGNRLQAAARLRVVVQSERMTQLVAGHRPVLSCAHAVGVVQLDLHGAGEGLHLTSSRGREAGPSGRAVGAFVGAADLSTALEAQPFPVSSLLVTGACHAG